MESVILNQGTKKTKMKFKEFTIPKSKIKILDIDGVRYELNKKQNIIGLIFKEGEEDYGLVMRKEYNGFIEGMLDVELNKRDEVQNGER